MKQALIFLYFFVCAMFLFSVTALAYIDPSAMTYIIQLVAGVAIAAGAAAGFYFRRAKRVFAKFRHEDNTSDNWDYDDEDDDETGFSDYDIEPSEDVQSLKQAKQAAIALSKEPACKRDEIIVAAQIDKYDETGGEAGLLAENRELRRLLSEEREKVELLKKTIHICTASKK